MCVDAGGDKLLGGLDKGSRGWLRSSLAKPGEGRGSLTIPSVAQGIRERREHTQQNMKNLSNLGKDPEYLASTRAWLEESVGTFAALNKSMRWTTLKPDFHIHTGRLMPDVCNIIDLGGIVVTSVAAGLEIVHRPGRIMGSVRYL